MNIAIFGLGKMGAQIARRLHKNQFNVLAWNRSEAPREEVAKAGVKVFADVSELVNSINDGQRVFWLMLPHGIVDEFLQNQLGSHLKSGDIVIDGGNSFYKESIRRGKEFAEKGIYFFDCGTSGGVWGEENGFALMAGGPKEQWPSVEPIFKALSGGSNYGLLGKNGAGHFTKMVHNGIEYGMMQSIAEGFDLMRHSKEFDLDLEKITEVYSHGSVVTSSLVSWMHDGYKKYGKDLNQISGRASASGEGKWTVEAGKRENISMPAIQTAVDVREKSQKKPSYQGKVISTMRGEFGQHSVKKGDDEPEIL